MSSSTRSATLHVVLDALERAEHEPAFLSFEAWGSRLVSHARLHAAVCGLAHGLAGEGLRRDATALVFAETSPEWVTACLGIVAAGAVAVPVDAQLQNDDLRRVLEDSGAEWAFVDERRASRLEGLGFEGRVVRLDLDGDDASSWRDLIRADTPTPDAPDPGDRALLFYTSGTTGPPKGVPLRHRHLAHQLRTLRESGLLRQDDRVLLPLPLHHVYPLVVGAFAPLSMGRTIVMPRSVTGPELLRAIREGEVSILIGVPRLLEALASGIEGRMRGNGRLRSALVGGMLRILTTLRRRMGLRAGSFALASLHRRVGPALRVLASGGSKLDPEVGARLEGMGWQIAIGYGLTETSPILTIAAPGEADLESVGKAIEGVELRVDPGARGAEDGDTGEILARGPSVFDGYHGLEEETREAFTDDGFFRTGDLGRIDEQGCVHLVGRSSTMLVTKAGENVPPERLEAMYESWPAIEEIGVLIIDDELAALVVPSREAGSNARATVEEALREGARNVPSHHRVSRFEVTRNALPRTRLGKIRRKQLLERYREAEHGEEAETTATRGPMPVEEMGQADRELVEDRAGREVWRLLARRHEDLPLTPDSEVRTDLGVDSLGWLDLSMRIQEQTGIELDEGRIASIETVRDLLRAVAKKPRDEAAAGRADPLDDPDAILNDEQRARLAPPSPMARRAAGACYRINRMLFERLYGLRVEGADNVPRSGPFVITPNHTSYLDPFAIAASLPLRVLRRTLWAGWTGAAFRNALFRRASRLARVVPVDSERAALSSLAFAGAVLDQGEGLVWFPEGERSEDGDLERFREGIGRVASERGEARIVPAHIDGTYEAWPPHRRFPRRGRITVRFGEPVCGEDLLGEGDAESATRALRERVARLRHDSRK